MRRAKQRLLSEVQIFLINASLSHQLAHPALSLEAVNLAIGRADITGVVGRFGPLDGPSYLCLVDSYGQVEHQFGVRRDGRRLACSHLWVPSLA